MVPKTVYVCSNCDAQFPKWSGRCLECGTWGTLGETEEKNFPSTLKKSKSFSSSAPAKVVRFSEIESASLKRIQASGFPFSQLFPRGLVAGSLSLFTGEPGSGKSTLALQLARVLSESNSVLYITAEESVVQVKERASRIGPFSPHCIISESTNFEEIAATVRQYKPSVVCIDSLQAVMTGAVSGEAGSLAQIRAVTTQVLELARSENVAVFLIGHVTKDGTLAGPKSLEHLVDAVYYLEADRHSAYRLLRVYKNRYGASGTVLVMHLASGGLQHVAHPATIFVKQYAPKAGSVVTISEIDDQLFFIEVQSLAARTSFGYAKRTSSGFSKSRLELLLAIIKKQLHIDTDTYDVYVNIAGGFSVHEPAFDLAVVLCVLSSITEKTLPPQTVVFGEVGLSGELRVVKDTGERIKVAAEHQYARVLFPPFEHAVRTKLTLVPCRTLRDVVKHLNW